MIVVTNPATGVWDSASAWRVVEELRIGTLDGLGPDLFGQINALEVDPAGQIYVIEGQAQELRVFDADGRHVRTIGRKGGGPEEFNQPIGLAWAPDGTLWVVDPENNRISVIDTAGAFVTSHHALGGFVYMPWPGGFDTAGVFYNYAPDMSAAGFRMLLVRYDSTLSPIDSIRPPWYEGPENFFELVRDRGRMRTGVPFSPSLDWALTRNGDFWFAMTGPYELYHRTAAGDTLRKVTRAFEPLSVTSEDVDSAVARLEWFTSQGGKVDRSRIPGVKPAIGGLIVADDGSLWIELVTREREDQGHAFDVFDPEGRYLGGVRLPFALRLYPVPIIRNGFIYGVTEDELEVPFVVRARIEKP
ncbi:MAG: 6-bladed beta-propeller [Gemmatimonadota bacterium]|nr:6-bladed beta-propeller [Gemmatimonadota bacterium]MDH4349611.1 6-bladed beta-propeller [Gemmatimonadota bacterium]MDH5195814.1 6-bladed beta-propeller [Gemmatimonadota bacterium]